MKVIDLPTKLANQIVESGACWIWTGTQTDEGYAYAWYDGRKRLIHRVTYEVLVGAIPHGLVLDHRECNTPSCVNPRHLEPVTQAENVRRSGPAQKTHCANGHEYTPENTYLRPGQGQGRRDCRVCIRDRVRRYSEHKKGSVA